METIIAVCLAAALSGCSNIPLDQNPTVQGKNWNRAGTVYTPPESQSEKGSQANTPKLYGDTTDKSDSHGK